VNAADWRDVAAGSAHVCAMPKDRTRWCWGSNLRAPFGNGSQTSSLVPIRIG
jgi:alpha-tubulin suppressor-like RCC1 family protein